MRPDSRGDVAQDLARAVRRAVVDDDQLERGNARARNREHATHRLRDEVALVVRGHDDGSERLAGLSVIEGGRARPSSGEEDGEARSIGKSLAVPAPFGLNRGRVSG
jgi:hypothetical protein